MKPSAAAPLWHSVWRLAAPSGEGRRIWRALAMIAAVEASSSSSKSSGRAARAGDLVVLGPALDPRVRVVLEVVPSGALETEMSEWLKEHDWKAWARLYTPPPSRTPNQAVLAGRTLAIESCGGRRHEPRGIHQRARASAHPCRASDGRGAGARESASALSHSLSWPQMRCGFRRTRRSTKRSSRATFSCSDLGMTRVAICGVRDSG